jgi:hypothetical protein
MCKLIRDESGLARVVHDSWREHMGEDGRASADVVAGAVAEVLSRHGTKPMGAQVLERHFTKHVEGEWAPKTLEAAVVAVPDVMDVARARLEREALELERADPRVGALGERDNDYFRMWELFQRLMTRVVALDKDPTAFWTADGRHDMHKLNVWTGMVSAARGVLSDLNKMRNSDRLTASILEQHTLKLSQSLAAGLGEQLRAVESAMPAMFRRAAEETLEMTRSRYGLVN